MLSGVWLALAIVAGNGAAPAPGNGVIEGDLLFPACDVPEDLEVCVEHGKEVACSDQLIFREGTIGYRMEVPAGEYRVFARTESMLPNVRAYYTKAVTCGLDVDCIDHQPITVRVRPGARLTSAHPADWLDPEPAELLVSND